MNVMLILKQVQITSVDRHASDTGTSNEFIEGPT